ncbi:MAG: transporter, partial [bacterium]
MREPRSNSRRRVALAGLTVLVSLGAAPDVVRAQTSVRQINLLSFEPAVSTHGILTLETSRTLPHLQWSVNAYFSYVNDALVVENQGATVYRFVGHQALMDVTAALGIWHLFELGLHLPVVLYQHGSPPSPVIEEDLPSLRSSAVGDLRIVPKARFWLNGRRGFGLAVIPQFTLPTGQGRDHAGEGTATFEPRIALDYRFRQGTVIALNVGYRLRRAVESRNLRVDDELFWGVGVEAPVWRRRLAVLGELNGAVGFRDAAQDPDAGIDEEELPLELMLGVRYRFPQGFTVTAGAGVGLTSGWGAPDFRLFLGVGYRPPVEEERRKFVRKYLAAPADRDGDGIPNDKDLCPDLAEDRDGYKDDDGCPDPDNDKDG